MFGFRGRHRHGRFPNDGSFGVSGFPRRHGTLAGLRTGQTGIVASENLPQDLFQKLFPLGLEREGEVEVLSGEVNNPFLIRTGSTRIMLDWATVSRIPLKG